MTRTPVPYAQELAEAQAAIPRLLDYDGTEYRDGADDGCADRYVQNYQIDFREQER